MLRYGGDEVTGRIDREVPLSPFGLAVGHLRLIEGFHSYSKLHSNQYLRRLRCTASHRTLCTASTLFACLLGLVLNAT